MKLSTGRVSAAVAAVCAGGRRLRAGNAGRRRSHRGQLQQHQCERATGSSGGRSSPVRQRAGQQARRVGFKAASGTRQGARSQAAGWRSRQGSGWPLRGGGPSAGPGARRRRRPGQDGAEQDRGRSSGQARPGSGAARRRAGQGARASRQEGDGRPGLTAASGTARTRPGRASSGPVGGSGDTRRTRASHLPEGWRVCAGVSGPVIERPQILSMEAGGIEPPTRRCKRRVFPLAPRPPLMQSRPRAPGDPWPEGPVSSILSNL